MKFKKAAAFGLALCLAVGSSGCGSEKTAVYVQQVSSLTGITTGERFSGLVVSENIAEIKKDSDKEVAELLVKEGQDVKEGDPLFTYDTDQLQLSADKLDLEREQLSASMDDYEVQIGELERDRDKAGVNQKLQYTIQIQTLQVSQKEAELNLKTKQAELEKARKLLENATITAPVTGRIQAVNENGTDSQGNPAAYITIQQAGSYRVKGVIGELQQGAIREGDRIRMISRVDSSKTWLGTVKLVDYENPIKEDNNRMASSDSMSAASKYPFYVELDSVDGLIMGQHLYLERDIGADGTVGIPLNSAYICFDENENAYVWAENSHGKLEKRPVTLGEYNEETDNYDVTDGLADTDFIAFPDEELCKPGAPTSHTPVTTDEGEEGADMGADMGMDAPMDSDMNPDAGADAAAEETAPIEGALEQYDNGAISDEDAAAAEEKLADGDISDADMEKALEGGVG